MFARISNGVVQEIVKPIDGFSIEQCFSPQIVATLVGCSSEVQPNWTYNAETGEFTAPQEHQA